MDNQRLSLRINSLDIFIEVLRSNLPDLDRKFKQIESTEATIKQLNESIAKAERDYDLNRAAEIKYNTIPSLQREIERTKKEIKEVVNIAVTETLKRI